MFQKMVPTAMFFLLLVSVCTLIFNIQPVKSEPETIIVPDEYSTIQEAINHANTGDTIYVRAGTYWERVVVNKEVKIFGEEKSSTIIDANFNGGVLVIRADNVVVSGFTIENSQYYNWGIRTESHNTIISNNIITDNFNGIEVVRSNNNTILNNTISNNWRAIMLGYSYDNVLFDNDITDNREGIDLGGCIDCVFYHNSFENPSQLNIGNSTCQWDNGCEGNYWSDYAGTDSDFDGIGDTPYIIDENNIDNYPLMNPYWIAADVNHDLTVNIFDVVKITAAYGTTPSSPIWNPHADIAESYGIIDIFDVVMCTSNYGKKRP